MTSCGASRSTRNQRHTSVWCGPRGCHTAIVRGWRGNSAIFGKISPGAPISRPSSPRVRRRSSSQCAEIFGDDRRVLIGGRRRQILWQCVDDGLMATVGDRDMEFAAEQQFGHVAAAGARGSDAGEIDRAVADVVIAVAAEILRREFPVARDQPFLDAAEHLGLAFAPIAAVQDQIEIAGEIAEIFGKGWSRRIPGGPDRALVIAQLGYLDEAPLRAVERSNDRPRGNRARRRACRRCRSSSRDRGR